MLPVVDSNIRGHYDVVENCVNGFLLGMENISGFEKTILTLYKNLVPRSEMGKHSIERVKMLSADKAINAIQEIYQSVM